MLCHFQGIRRKTFLKHGEKLSVDLQNSYRVKAHVKYQLNKTKVSVQRCVQERGRQHGTGRLKATVEEDRAG